MVLGSVLGFDLKGLALILGVCIGNSTHATENFWSNVCSEDRCVAVQKTGDNAGNIVMETRVSQHLSGGLTINVRVPNKVSLLDGPWLTADGVYIGELDYLQCPDNCFAEITLSKTIAEALLSVDKGMITLVGMDGRRLGVAFRPAGLADILQAKPSQ